MFDSPCSFGENEIRKKIYLQWTKVLFGELTFTQAGVEATQNLFLKDERKKAPDLISFSDLDYFYGIIFLSMPGPKCPATCPHPEVRFSLCDYMIIGKHCLFSSTLCADPRCQYGASGFDIDLPPSITDVINRQWPEFLCRQKSLKEINPKDLAKWFFLLASAIYKIDELTVRIKNSKP